MVNALAMLQIETQVSREKTTSITEKLLRFISQFNAQDENENKCDRQEEQSLPDAQRLC